MKPKAIAIIGLGLMGGSLAAACRKKFPEAKVIGISRDPKALRLGLQRKWLHAATTDLKNGIQSADLVVICTPVNTLKGILKKIEAFAKPGTWVTDVGSVKGEIVSWTAKQKWKRIAFVGAHPMVGSHERGMQVSRPDLYERGFTFITKSGKTSAEAYAGVKSFWKAISPKVFEVSPELHDKITGQISHLPHLVAAALVLAVDKQSLAFAGSGFLDATRIAEGHPSLWFPIFSSNRRQVLRSLTVLEKVLRKLKKQLHNASPNLEKMLHLARNRRRQISL